MITVQRTFDYEAVNTICNDKDVFDSICDDATSGQPFDAKDILSLDAVLCYLLIDDKKAFGVLMFLPWMTTILDAHIACLKEYRGKKLVMAAKLAIRSAFNQANVSSIIAACPSFNKPSMVIATLAGFSRVGIIPKCYIKNGKAHDLALLQINKGEI